MKEKITVQQDERLQKKTPDAHETVIVS